MKKTTKKTNTVTIPAGLTAKQIYDDCKNMTGSGKELLHGDWFKGHKFWDTEETCAMTVTVPSGISRAGKSYDEIRDELGERRIPNVAEVLWVMKSSEAFNGLFNWKNDVCFTWTSTKTDDGYYAYLGFAGFWDSFGSLLSRNSARFSDSRLGLGLSCNASGTDEDMDDGAKEAGQADVTLESLDARLKRVEGLFSPALL